MPQKESTCISCRGGSIGKCEYLIKFLKCSGAKTYSAKEGDTDIINKAEIIKAVPRFVLNNKCQYLVEYLNFHLDTQ